MISRTTHGTEMKPGLGSGSRAPRARSKGTVVPRSKGQKAIRTRKVDDSVKPAWMRNK